jgi:DNA-binding LytR/AlgR family response regulator
MNTIRCLVVDDEPYARELLLNYIRRIPELVLVDSCRSAPEAIGPLYGSAVDLLFLDIKMPVMAGTDFLRSLARPPLVIFTTAYAHYATEGFELNAVDYLLKPITSERFMQAVLKADERMGVRQQPAGPKPDLPDYLFIKQDNKLLRIDHRDIDYIQAEKDFCSVYLGPRRILAGMHLKLMEEILPPELFMRVHRSYIVPLEKIRAIKGNMLELPGMDIPIGESYKELLMRKLRL